MFSHKIIAHCIIIKIIIIIYVKLLITIQAYNLNIYNAKVFNHPHKYQQHRETYFGFTVALYNGPNYNDQSVIVGAPRANTSQISIIEPGTVYKCALNDNCMEWNLDNTVNDLHNSGTIFRDNSWLGASISVENTVNPKIVVCAPRWKIKWGTEWYMNGICYYAEINVNRSFNETPIDRIMSVTNRYHQTAKDLNNNVYYKYGMALLGFSLHTFSYDERWIGILGGPGAHSSLGTTVLVSRNISQFNNIIGDYDEVTNEYLGYSVTSGKYFDNDEIQFAAGAPRTADMKGRVRIFYYNSHMKISQVIDTLSGTQKGEYFGSSLTSCDVNNDGKDEIIVGAPLWTKNGDEGNVYIFTTKNTRTFELSSQINGQIKDGRFGTTITCLDDIDRDGYKDIAVGAPYENNHGAIYIFNGNRDGLSTISSQRISGDEFPYNLRGFGISISEPRDIDGNGYFDVAIGAYLSGHAVILRSQPVVTVNIELFTEEMKLMSDATSFPIRICGSYNGVRAPNSLDTIIKLNVDSIYERGYIEILKREDRTYHMPCKLFHREKICQNITILLKERNQNVIDPIDISASLILNPKFISSSMMLKNFYFNEPVINKNISKATDNITIVFAVNCGIDNICHSNITLDIITDLDNNNHFIIGSKNGIKLFINVHNYGEAAYQTQVHILIPDAMALGNIPVNCIHATGISKVICNIENPLIKQSNFTLELTIRQMQTSESHVEIFAFVSTKSINLNSYENKKNLTIYFDNDVDIAVSGNAYENSYSCFDAVKNHTLEIIKFQHVYEIHKFGITPIIQSQLTISIPIYLIDRENKNIIEIVKINGTNISLRESIIGQNSYCNRKQNYNIHNELKYTEINNPNNSTLYINCTNPLIICETISCFLETSSNSLIIGQVMITMELQLKNIIDNAMNETNIIYFISNGHVNVTSPTGIIQKLDNRHDYSQVRTSFDTSTAIPTSKNIPIWIIVLSALLGILLLALLTFGLIKLGFFNRKKKEELETLKSNEDKKYNIILETSSSTEMLDQD